MSSRLATIAAAAAVLLVAACSGPTTATTEPSAASADAPVTLFLGDSYTEGSGLATEDLPTRWSTVLAARLGWTEVNAGCNGSGYTRPGSVCGNNYVERLPLLADAAPDVIIVSGGVNDLGATELMIDTQVREIFTALRETFPDAELYAVNGIYYTGTETPPLLAYLNESVSHAVTLAGGTYLDIGDPLLGHPELMGPDRVHPNPAGHELIADLTQDALDRAGAFKQSNQAG